MDGQAWAAWRQHPLALSPEHSPRLAGLTERWPTLTRSQEEAIFIVTVIINPLIKVSFIQVNILPLPPRPLFQHPFIGLVSTSSSSSNSN